LKEAGSYREALKKFEAAKVDPAYRFKATAQSGFCLRAIGKLEDAGIAFRHALALNGAKATDILHVRYVLALTLDTLDHRNEAQEQYREIYEADPNFKDVANRIGSVDDSPGFPLSLFKSLRQNWQQFRGTAVKRPLTGEVRRLKAEG
jgi:tetratricopeptide (TPR) repeat protein